MLLVVVDQPRVGRRGDDAVVRAAEIELAGVAVQDRGSRTTRAHAREVADPRERVQGVAAQEVLGALDGTARLAVLVAPVLLDLGLAREVEVEVRRPAGRPGGAREHDAHHVRVLVVVDQRAVEDELCGGLRCEPAVDVGVRPRRAHPVEGLEPAERVAQLVLEREQVVLGRLDAHEQAVEGGHVHAGRVATALERLDERRPRACERIEDVLRPRQMPVDQRLDELRHELPEVRVQPVDVLRALPLGQVALRPGEIPVDVELAVERVLRRSHRSTGFYGPRTLLFTIPQTFATIGAGTQQGEEPCRPCDPDRSGLSSWPYCWPSSRCGVGHVGLSLAVPQDGSASTPSESARPARQWQDRSSARVSSPPSWQLEYATCAKLINYPDAPWDARGRRA